MSYLRPCERSSVPHACVRDTDLQISFVGADKSEYRLADHRLFSPAAWASSHAQSLPPRAAPRPRPRRAVGAAPETRPTHRRRVRPPPPVRGVVKPPCSMDDINSARASIAPRCRSTAHERCCQLSIRCQWRLSLPVSSCASSGWRESARRSDVDAEGMEGPPKGSSNSMECFGEGVSARHIVCRRAVHLPSTTPENLIVAPVISPNTRS